MGKAALSFRVFVQPIILLTSTPRLPVRESSRSHATLDMSCEADAHTWHPFWAEVVWPCVCGPGVWVSICIKEKCIFISLCIQVGDPWLQLLKPFILNYSSRHWNFEFIYIWDNLSFGDRKPLSVCAQWWVVLRKVLSLSSLPPSLPPSLLQCSTTCGLGAYWRSVECSSGVDADCTTIQRPDPAKKCHLRPCAGWRVGNWSKVIFDTVFSGKGEGPI
jgi:hypothetical protein